MENESAAEIDFSETKRLPESAIRFIEIFMRFEFALKEMGFLLGLGDGNKAEPNWDLFANCEHIGRQFFRLISTSGKVNTLINHPPKEQINRSGNLDWIPKCAVSTPQDLFGAIRRVRNNLLHGGKSGDPDHDRNEALIAESIIVLEEALRAHHDVRARFEGKY